MFEILVAMKHVTVCSSGVSKQESRFRVLNSVVFVHALLLCFRNRLPSFEVGKFGFPSIELECVRRAWKLMMPFKNRILMKT